MSEKITAYSQIWEHYRNKDYKAHREEWESVSSLGKIPENKDKTFRELEERVREINSERKMIPAKRSLKTDLVDYRSTLTKLPKPIIEMCYDYAITLAFPDDLADINDELNNLLPFAEALIERMEEEKAND